MTRYEQGANLERLIVNRCRGAGIFSLRSAGSKTIVDGVIYYRGIMFPFQAKKGGSKISVAEKDKIYDFMGSVHVPFLLIEKPLRSAIKVTAMGGLETFKALELEKILNKLVEK